MTQFSEEQNEKEASVARPEDLALAIGAKALHEGRRFSYDMTKVYHDSWKDTATGLYRNEYLEQRLCPVCHGDQFSVLFKKNGGRYVQCADCRMCYLNPVFTDEALFRFYGGYTTAQSQVVDNESDFYRKIYAKGLTSIAAHIKPGSILDVGCSSGVFLDLAREHGWLTSGAELNREELAIARGKGHFVKASAIENLHFSEQFDAISLWDVFEHIKDGTKVLDLLRNQLKPGGIVFLQVPNFESLATRVLHENCRMFDGVEHVNLYSAHTIRKLAETCRFSILDLSSVISEIPIVENYLDFQDPYFGTSPHGGKVLGLITEEMIHANNLGYKMQITMRAMDA